MSKRANDVEISNTNSKKLKKERSADEAKTEIFYKIIKQIKDILEDPIEKDSTDSLEDTIKDIFQPILDEFKDLIKENEGKKYFIGGLIKIFSILLSSRATHNLNKNYKGSKNKHTNYSRFMAKTKATVRRLRQPTFVAAPSQRIGNKNIMNWRKSMFKIKTLLPQPLQVEVKKNGRRKSNYFSGNRKLRF